MPRNGASLLPGFLSTLQLLPTSPLATRPRHSAWRPSWKYHRQGWIHRGALHAGWKVLKRTSNLGKNTGKSFYDPMGLPGDNLRRFTGPEWLWSPSVRQVKQLLSRQ